MLSSFKQDKAKGAGLPRFVTLIAGLAAHGLKPLDKVADFNAAQAETVRRVFSEPAWRPLPSTLVLALNRGLHRAYARVREAQYPRATGLRG